MDPRFWHLVRWESRSILGRRQVVWCIGLGLLGVGIAVGVWWVATLPQGWLDLTRRFNNAGDLITMALAGLLATPFRDPVVSVAQMTFGYTLLRFAGYGLLAVCKVLLPAIAAGSIAKDRQAQRLHDLQMMPIPPAVLYLAKAIAAALPFLTLGGLLLVCFAGVVIQEGVPVREIGRLSVEVGGQILLMAFVGVTCSVLCASPWAARSLAYLLLWLALPLLWLILLLKAGAVRYFPLIERQIDNDAIGRHSLTTATPIGFTALCMLHLGLTVVVCLVALLLGVHKLRNLGAVGVVGRAQA
jgi:hypothetical protein